MNARYVLRVMAVALMLQATMAASCDNASLIEPPQELSVALTANPARVLQGEEALIEIVITNNTGREIMTTFGCCWTFQLYTSDMRELNVYWVCPLVTCPPRSLKPGERLCRSQRFSTVALPYEDTWPLENGMLAVGKYIVRSGLGDLPVADDAEPWAQTEFWVVREK